MHYLVLERTESDLSKINWLRGIVLLIPIVLVPWGRFPLCHTLMTPILVFRNQISILIVGCVTTWSRGSHQLVSELGSETRSYPFVVFDFFLVFLIWSRQGQIWILTYNVQLSSFMTTVIILNLTIGSGWNFNSIWHYLL